jgi:hypothetical protein
MQSRRTALRFVGRPLTLFAFALSAPAYPQDAPVPGSRVELKCDVDREAVKLSSTRGKATEQQLLDFLSQNEILSFRVAYWQTTGNGCKGLVGRHSVLCVVTDNAVSFFPYPELPAEPGVPQPVLLDRYSGVLRFTRYQRLQHICVPQRQLF